MSYHPCSKEFQEEANKLGDPIDIHRDKQQELITRNKCKDLREYRELFAKKRKFGSYKEYRDHLARLMGYNRRSERDKDWRYDTLRSGSMIENEECASYFGVYIAERYVRELFEDPIPMPINNPGFDWICKKGFKIGHKARCLEECTGSIRWIFDIKYNNMADYFILSGWKDRTSLKPMYVWMIDRNEIIRGRKFWRIERFNITYKQEYLLEFKKYELPDKLEKLKDICNTKLQ